MIPILRSLWAIYCYIMIAIVVIPTSIIVFISTFLFKNNAKTFNLFMCLKVSSPLIMLLSGIWVRVRGKSNLEPNKGYVIISNHQSYMDIFANPTSIPRHNIFTFLAKSELGKTPFFGIIAKNLGVLVNRKSMESRKKSYIYMKKVLENGFSIFVYPEGTRNKSNEVLLPFFDGAFKLAKDMNVPIVVNTLVGMKKRNNINRFLDMSPGVLDSYIEKPIETENKSVQELKEICIDLMKKRLQA